MSEKKEFKKYEEQIIPLLQESFEYNGNIDYPARRQAWNDLIDILIQDGNLPEKAKDWICPW